MKLRNKKLVQKNLVPGNAGEHDKSLCHKGAASSKRGCLMLSERDMAVIRQLAQNPPAPTPELVEALSKVAQHDPIKIKDFTP